MPMGIPQAMKDYMATGKVPLRALCLDLTVDPDIFNFATRKLTISGVTYQPYLVLNGDYQAFGGQPADRAQLQIQNIDKAMSAFFHTNLLESAPATVFLYFPQFDFKFILVKGRVTFPAADGNFATFETRSRLDATTLRIPKRYGQGLCPWATTGNFDDGSLSDVEALCPYRDEGKAPRSATTCNGSRTQCEDYGMYDPANEKFYFGGIPIFSSTESNVLDAPDVPFALPFPFGNAANIPVYTDLNQILA